jgi:hypothetical protein
MGILDFTYNAVCLSQHGWAVIGMHMPTREKVYAVSFDIKEWIETQPSHLWKSYEVAYDPTPHYLLSEELLAWMTLKFH